MSDNTDMHDAVRTIFDDLCLFYTTDDVVSAAQSLQDNGFEVVKLPELASDGEVPVPEIDEWARVYRRRTDGRIGLDGVPSPLPSDAAAIALAGALLAMTKGGDQQ